MPTVAAIEETHLVSIRTESLTGCDVAADGSACRLRFLDAEGVEHSLELPKGCLQQLIQAIAMNTREAPRNLHRDRAVELVHVVRCWRVRSTTNQRVIFSFTTPDGCSLSFDIASADLGDLAEPAVEYEVEAYPEGLRFPRRLGNR